MSDVSDFLRTHQYESAGPITGGDGAGSSDGSTVAEPMPRASDLADAITTFRDLAVSGDVDGLVSLIAQQRLRGQTLPSIFDGVARPALVDIGDRWSRGVLTTTQEHIASNAVIESLARTRPLIERPAGVDRGRALLACLGEEQHDIALRMASLMVHGSGYVARLVGPRTPAMDLALQIAAERPRVVLLSASELAEPVALARDLTPVAESSRSVGAQLLLGGRGFERLAELPHGSRCFGSLRELAQALTLLPG